MNEQYQANPSGGTGFLIVQVTTANSAIPLPNAQVTIFSDAGNETNVIYELRTGESGRTARVPLAAPPRAASETQGNDKPFATYHIEVVLPGYQKSVYNQVPIFDGITAIQQADLIPVSENRYTDSLTQNTPNIFQNTPPEL